MKKHHKKKFKRFLLIIVLLAIGGYFLYQGGYNLLVPKEVRELKQLHYNDKAISLIIENKIDKYLINNNLYSKTLEVALTSGEYEKSLLEKYIDIPYQDDDNFIKHINKLYDLGYTQNDIKTIFKVLDTKDIDVVISQGKVVDNLTSYLDNKYFNIDNLSRYVAYKGNNKKYDYDTIILRVNMYLDYPYYEHDVIINNDSDNLLIIANKYYKLGSDYAPKGLVKIDAKHSYGGNTYQVLPIVKENFDIMVKDMEKTGLGIQVKSAYRSYQTQLGLYNDYVKQNGKDYTDAVSARAGYSEHQTGLAIDVKTTNGNYATFVDSAEYKWMKDNSYKYGFIQRYPKEKENITGYNFESWHYRYVGKDVAKYIYEHDITFDEYYAMFIAK